MAIRPVIWRLAEFSGNSVMSLWSTRLLIGGILGLEGEAFGVHLDFGVGRADLKGDIDGDAAAHFEHDAGLLVGLKAGGGDAQAVRPGAKPRKDITRRRCRCA